ncbi:MAG: DUF1569 domain-containing protein [Phycisphaerales bacterium]|nr:DUF1569 domain-containing protein [Phycisphaerales bacterium]MCB9840816.1 DUF1569 domain-containing protein [Phycisphaeraceae bacterium]
MSATATPETTGTIDTKTAEHRAIRFENLDEMVREAERLVWAEREGTLRATGNWSLGQALGHVASWMDYPFDGYPPEVRPPWFIKLILRTQKKKFLNAGLQRGVKIPGIKGGTLAIRDEPADEALAHLRKATQRLKAQAPTRPNPIFGPLTHEEWTKGNLRHAELHLGFFHTM